jgi:hypothetical protein
MAQAADMKDNQGIPITLGGKERNLRYDLNAFSELEVKYGSVEQALKGIEGGNIQQIRYILWTGLIHEEAILDEKTGDLVRYGISPFQVGSWITIATLPSIVEKLTAAIEQGMPEDTKQKIREAEKELNEKNPKIAVVLPAEGEETKNG